MALAMVKIQAAALPRGILTMLKCFGAVAAVRPACRLSAAGLPFIQAVNAAIHF
jgi:hypothetical protein